MTARTLLNDPNLKGLVENRITLLWNVVPARKMRKLRFAESLPQFNS
jgi:hypothetical protein